MRRFLHFNPGVGTHFQSKVKKAATEDAHEKGVDAENAEDEKRSTMFEMHRKTLSKALFSHEIINELNDRNLTRKFGPMVENGVRKTFEDSKNDFMKHIDHLRSHETYKHENCSKGCSDRGCKYVMVIDGNWKLRYPICLWNTAHAYPAELTEFLPNVCTEAPSGDNAFCINHCETAKKLGRPTKLSDFLSHCGADPNAYNLEGKGKVASVLKQMADLANDKCEVDDTQNTAYLLRNQEIANQTNFSSVRTNETTDCKKDLGDKSVHKLTRSHGVFAGISGGGLIRNWAPLYKSEGVTQEIRRILNSFLPKNALFICKKPH